MAEVGGAVVERRGEFFSYDPLTGLEERYEERDGKIHLHTYQEVGKILDHTKALRNEGQTDAAWKKQGFTSYAQLPLIAIGHMAKKGIRMFDPNHGKAVLREVNQNYQYCITTDKRHG